MQIGGPSDKQKLDALQEAEKKNVPLPKTAPKKGAAPKYTAPALTQKQLQTLAPFYVQMPPKPAFLNPKRIGWYWLKHKERVKLRRQLKADYGIKKRREFEDIAREVGLGIDNPVVAMLWWGLTWLVGSGGLASLVGAAALMLGGMYAYSYISEQVGSFTIQLNNSTMQDGFVLSESPDFTTETGRLISEQMPRVNAISLDDLDRHSDEVDGCHNGAHNVAYTFYIKNKSAVTSSYEYVLQLTDSMFGTEKAVWVMLFEDGKQVIYAAPSASDGEGEALVGYARPPFFEQAYDCAK